MRIDRANSNASERVLSTAEAAANHASSLEEFRAWCKQLWSDIHITQADDHLWLWPFGLTQGTCVRVELRTEQTESQEEAA